MSRDTLLKDIKRLFQLWAEAYIFNETLTTGWMATLTFNRDSSLAYTISNRNGQ